MKAKVMKCIISWLQDWEIDVQIGGPYINHNASKSEVIRLEFLQKLWNRLFCYSKFDYFWYLI